MFVLVYSEKEFQIQVHGCQEIKRRAHRQLVQSLFLLEWLHRLWNMGLPDEVSMLGMLR